jgi:pentafunctional AROM polypeptide
MRAAGKTTLGRAAAAHLGYEHLDLDAALESGVLKQSITSFVAANGWPAFRTCELALLQEILITRRESIVLSCGGGVVESEAARDLLRSHGWHVVWVDRTLEDISATLAADEQRAPLSEPIEVVFQRRRTWYHECCSQIFHILPQSPLPLAIEEFSHFVEGILGRYPMLPRDGTSMLCLTLPDVRDAIGLGMLSAATEGVQAVELRVDLLSSQEPDYVIGQFAHLRRALKMPIVYTVRSAGQGGAFRGTMEQYFSLLSLGIALGCDGIDVEACWPASQTAMFLRETGHAIVIGSIHVTDLPVEAAHFQELVHRCHFHGAAAIVKIVYVARDPYDNVVLAAAAREAQTVLAIPVIALLMGPFGQLSRALNRVLTPVTHPLLPFPAAPGQLSIAEINRIRRDLSINPARHFYICGHPVAQSSSPAMHNAAFKSHGLPHMYSTFDSDDAKVVAKLLRGPGVGGASITIPLKEAMLPYVNVVSYSAGVIGAINTVICEAGLLIGDNTDWLGIRAALAPHLGAAPRHTALVLGAGGTSRAACYALRRMGFADVLVYNRTLARAEKLASDLCCRAVDSLEGLPALQAVVSTLPPGAPLPDDAIFASK